MSTDLERIIEARERDVAAGHVGNPATAFDYCKECFGLAALGGSSVALARAAHGVMAALEEYGPSIVPHLLDTDENDGQRLRDALAEWAQAGAQHAQGAGASGALEDTQKAP